tara:strand:+ start:3993 stop:4355 length:363 start_codon:yes stop_codon:yes gene_type:complete
MQTRSQSRNTNQTEIFSGRTYSTRLKNRIQKLKVNTDNNDVNNNLGPAYNTRLAHNVLSPKSYCIKSEITREYTPTNHRYNTRYSSNFNKKYNVDIDFDDASREWNRNKRRVGLMYEYTC